MEFLPAGGRAALPGYAPDSSAGSLEGSNHEIPRSADRDPGPLVYWHRRIWNAQAADYCRPCSRFSGERAAAIARNRPGAFYAATSSVHIVKMLSAFGPKLLLIATSAATATAGDQRPANTRDVVARVKGASFGARDSPRSRLRNPSVHLKPARRYRRDNRAVTRRDVHAATQRDCEVRIIPPDAGAAIAEGFPSRPAGPGVFVVKGNMLVNVVADGLDAAPQPSRVFRTATRAVSESRSASQYRLPRSNTKASLSDGQLA